MGAACFERFHGMWGLVLLDGRRRVAVISRDRLGIKPVYLLQTADWIAIASEIKQFRCLPEVRLTPNADVVHDYLRTGYEREGQSFFKGVVPLPPGTFQEISLEDGKLTPPTAYWFPEQIRASVADPVEAGRRFQQVFQEAVRIHMRSDVPVGCALSGGIDSSAVAGFIRNLGSNGSHKLQTFSVVFPGTPIDETPFVEQVVAAVGAEAHYITPSAEDFLDDLDRFLEIHDEPVGSVAQYAGYALARLTRSAGVPVSLNGQGGDELLGGYWQSYFMHLRGLFRSGRLFRLGHHFAGALLPGGNSELPRQVPVMWHRYRSRRKTAARAASVSSSGKMAVAGSTVAGSARNRIAQWMDMSETERRLHEIRTMYLPRLLKWDDRNFMAFAVEGRYPFLDHSVIELALSFSSSVLYSRGWTKEPLRRGAQGLIPQSIARRRTKWGFETPFMAWIRGPLRAPLANWLAADSPAWDFVSREETKRLAEDVWNRPNCPEETAQMLMWAYFVHRWLLLVAA